MRMSIPDVGAWLVSSITGVCGFPLELRQSIDQSVLCRRQGAAESAPGICAGARRRSLLCALASLDPHPGVLPLDRMPRASGATIVTALPHHESVCAVTRLFEELNATLAAYIRAQAGGVCFWSVPSVVWDSPCWGFPIRCCSACWRACWNSSRSFGPHRVGDGGPRSSAHDATRCLALWAVGFLGVLRLVEDYVIYPRLMRRGIRCAIRWR
jgi:hypothetical protein